ncbi:hypothetical protein BJ912DRAFT_499685 [Pholiota molesta]|nr:hypothetical protein BJ912DRAFT_499685 [Pholiota molesta]
MLTGVKPVQWTLANLPNLIPKGATQLALAAGAAVTKQVFDIFLADDVQNAPYPAIDFAEKASNPVQQNAPQATWDAAVHVVAHPKHQLSSVAHPGAFAPKHIATPTQLSPPESLTPTIILLILAAIMIIVAASGAGFVVERPSQRSYNSTHPHQSRGTAGSSSRRPNAPAGSSSRRRSAGGSGGGSGGGRRPQAPSPEPEHNPNCPVGPDSKSQPLLRRPGGAPPPPPPPPPPSTTVAAGRNRNPGGALEFVDGFLVTLILALVWSLLPKAIAFVKRLRKSSSKSDVVQPTEGVAARNSTATVVKPKSGPQCSNTIPLPIALASTPTDAAPVRATAMISRYTAYLPLMTPPPIIDIDEPEPVQITLNVEESQLRFTLLSPSSSTSYPLLILLFACDCVLLFACTACVSLAPPALCYCVRYLMRTSWADVQGAQLLMGGDVVVEKTCNDVQRIMPVADASERQEPTQEAGPSTELVSVNPKEQEIGPSTPVLRPRLRPLKRRLVPKKRANFKDLPISYPAPVVDIEQSVEPSVDQDLLPAILSHNSEVEETIESSSTEKIECDDQKLPFASISEPELPTRSPTPTPKVEETTTQDEQMDTPAAPIQTSLTDKDADNQPRTPTTPIPELQQIHHHAAAENDEAQIAGPSVPSRRMLQRPIRLPKPSTFPRHPKKTPSVAAPPPEIEHAIQSPAADEQEAVFLPQAEPAPFVPSPAPEKEEAKAQWDQPHQELAQPVPCPASEVEATIAKIDYDKEQQYPAFSPRAEPAYFVPSPASEKEEAMTQWDQPHLELAQPVPNPASEVEATIAKIDYDTEQQYPAFLPQAEPAHFVPSPASESQATVAKMNYDSEQHYAAFLAQAETAHWVPSPAPEQEEAMIQWGLPDSELAQPILCTASELKATDAQMFYDLEKKYAAILPPADTAHWVPNPAPEQEETMAQWGLPRSELVRPVSPVSALEATMEQVDYDYDMEPLQMSFATEEEARDPQMQSLPSEPTDETMAQSFYYYTPEEMAQMMAQVASYHTEYPPSFEGFATDEEARDPRMEFFASEPTDETTMAESSYTPEYTSSIEGFVAEEETRDQQSEFAAPEPTDETMAQAMAPTFFYPAQMADQVISQLSEEMMAQMLASVASYPTDYPSSFEGFATGEEARDPRMGFLASEPTDETMAQMAQSFYAPQYTSSIEGFVTEEETRDQQTEFTASEPMLNRPVRPLPKRRSARVIVSEPSVSSESPVASELPAVHVAPEPVFDALDILATAAESRMQELHAQASTEVPEVMQVGPRIIKALPKGRILQPRAPDPNIFNFVCISSPAEKVAEAQGEFLFGPTSSVQSPVPEHGEAMAQTVMDGRAVTDVAAPETRVNEDTEDISREDDAAAADSDDDDEMEEVPIPEYLVTS